MSGEPDRVPEYRLYTDEVGHASFKNCELADRRFLSLTGVACRLEDVRTTVSPELTRIKEAHFDAHPDDEPPLVLHRKDLLDRRGPFNRLLDPERGRAFDAAIYDALERWPYTVFTAVLDKHAFQEQRPASRPEAYAHVLGALVACYARWLGDRQSRGDVLVESRGGKEDMALKRAFHLLVTSGGPDTPADEIRPAMNSDQLKVSRKQANVPGLQLADLLAHPSAGAVQAGHGFGTRPADFGGRVVDLLDLHKYARLTDGKVENVGCLWLPARRRPTDG